MSTPTQVTITVPITVDALAAIKNDANSPEMQALLDTTKEAVTRAAEALPDQIEVSSQFDDVASEDETQVQITVYSPNTVDRTQQYLHVVGSTTLKEFMQMYEGYTGLTTSNQRVCFKSRIICDGDQDVRCSLQMKHFFSMDKVGGHQVTIFAKAEHY